MFDRWRGDFESAGSKKLLQMNMSIHNNNEFKEKFTTFLL